MQILLSLSILNGMWLCLVGLSSLPLPPDRLKDGDYTETQIKHISDADLFAALDLDQPALAAVKKAVDASDYPAAYQAWGEYWAKKDKITLAQYGNPELDGELLPAAEIEARLRADPAQGKPWIRRAEPVMRHEITGWGCVTHQHGEVVDFNFDYGYNGKFGFHYWFWAEPLLMAYTNSILLLCIKCYTPGHYENTYTRCERIT